MFEVASYPKWSYCTECGGGTFQYDSSHLNITDNQGRGKNRDHDRDCILPLPVRQGCGAGTDISGSSSRHLNFLAPAPTSRSFWIRPQNDFVHWTLKNVLSNSLAQQTISVEPEPKYQAPALAPYLKIAWAPAPQRCRQVQWQYLAEGRFFSGDVIFLTEVLFLCTF